VKGVGGCVLLDSLGRLAFPFNSPHLVRGWLVDAESPNVAIGPDEESNLS
jgi:hypothetical protein